MLKFHLRARHADSSVRTSFVQMTGHDVLHCNTCRELLVPVSWPSLCQPIPRPLGGYQWSGRDVLEGISRVYGLKVIGWTNNWCIRMECSTRVRRLLSWATFVVAAVCSLNQNVTPLPHLPCLAFHQDPVEYIDSFSHMTCDCSTNLVMCCAIDQVIWLTVPQKLMKYKNHR